MNILNLRKLVSIITLIFKNKIDIANALKVLEYIDIALVNNWLDQIGYDWIQ